jgi:hypothetical protein
MHENEEDFMKPYKRPQSVRSEFLVVVLMVDVLSNGKLLTG